MEYSFKTRNIKYPLAQDYTVINKVDTLDWYGVDPSIIILPDGTYMASMAYYLEESGRNFDAKVLDMHISVSVSKDKGKNWNDIAKLPYGVFVPFCFDGELYAFVQHKAHSTVMFIKSNDMGYTWSEPVVITEEPLFINHTHFLRMGNYVYLIADRSFHSLVAMRCDLSKGIMNPDAWIISNEMDLPNIPDLLIRKDVRVPFNARSVMFMAVIEGIITEVNGRMIVTGRPYYLDNIVPNLAAVAELFDDGDKLRLEFAHYYPFPCAQVRYDVAWDEESKLFWMIGNTQTNGLDLLNCREELNASGFVGGPGNDRRFLTLWFSTDSLNWMPVGLVAGTSDMLQSFHYPSMCIEGDDIIMAVRTSVDGDNQHDSDLLTFHRIENFRDLAFDIYPHFGKREARPIINAENYSL